SKEEASEHWQNKFETETQRATYDDSGKYCTPIVLHWKFTGKPYIPEKNYSIFEDGWLNLKDSALVKELTYLPKYKENDLDRYLTDFTVRERPINIYKNG